MVTDRSSAGFSTKIVQPAFAVVFVVLGLNTLWADAVSDLVGSWNWEEHPVKVSRDGESELVVTIHYRQPGVVDDADEFGICPPTAVDEKVRPFWGKGRGSSSGLRSSGMARMKNVLVSGFDVVLDLKWSGPNVGQGEFNERFHCGWTEKEQVFEKDGFVVTVTVEKKRKDG